MKDKIKNEKDSKYLFKKIKDKEKFEGLDITEQRTSTGAEIFVFLLCTIAIFSKTIH